MKRVPLRHVALGMIIVFAVLAHGAVHGAVSDNYRYKWPFRPTTAATVTTYPFQQEHGCLGHPETNPIYPNECVAAYDLVINDRNVVSSSEGVITVADSTLNQCNATWGLGVRVFVGNIKYGHLASIATGIGVGTPVLQGDALGVQGNTGNTLPPQCGEHLHWEFGGIT